MALAMAVVSVAIGCGWHYLAEHRSGGRLWQTISEQWRGRAAHFFYFVGIPYLALLFGILTPQLLGLKGLEYFHLINWSADTVSLQIQQAVTLLLLEGLLDFNTTLLAGSVALLVFTFVWVRLGRQGLSPTRQPLVTVIYYALHWTFYRAVFWAVTGSLYSGVILGVGLVLLEWGLISMVKKQSPLQNQELLLNAIILILTATIFYYSPNLWLLLPIHWVMAAMINAEWAVKPSWTTQSKPS